MELDLKIKYNKFTFYFAIFFAVVALVFILATVLSFNDYTYALELGKQVPEVFGTGGIGYYTQIVTDLRTDFILNLAFTFFSFGLSAYCAVERIRSSRRSKRYSSF
ncbi:MAG: hypothetical protein ACTSVK_08475 [Promethearchaeota archaeon]